MPGYLQKLEILNFKSYNGKHVIGFDRFSAIIGPNGCGKSNMMDAISFVLGEKTSNLRVKTVKDLIHGAPINRPVATTALVAAYYVEENSKGKKTETIFSRKIVGSGTEYRINGKTVTNKEYQQALENIGILIKAKNFLVFQGAVESIAMKNPKERTEMFEKISGSGLLADDYEKKKQAMQKAEEDTTFSLHKKKGINAEKKEAKAEKDEAEKYQKLEQDLLDAKLEAQLFRLFHTERDIKNIEAEIKDYTKDLNKMSSKKEAFETQLQAKKSEGGKVSREIALKEKQVTEKEAELNKKRPLFIKAKQSTQHQQKKLEDTKKAYGKTKKNVEKQKNEVDELEKQLTEVQEMSAQYDQEVSQESQGQSLELMGSQLGEYNRLKETAGKQAAAVQTRLDKIMRDQNGDQENLAQLKQKKKDLETRKVDLGEQRQQLLQRIEQLEEYIKTNVESKNKLTEEYEASSASVQDANEKHQRTNELLEDVQNQLNEAKADRSESTRTQKKQEFIDNLKRLYPGVYGRLVDLCEPVHKRYAVAITKILGKYMDAIVVDTEKTGRDCIQYMKEQMIRRETYLPLDTLKTNPINDQLRQVGGTAKLVVDVIKYDPAAIKKALVFACGNALVCDTTDEARRLAFNGHERKKTVSIEGTMFEKSGVMSGGLGDIKRKAKRWDTKQVDGLKKKRDQFVKELKDLQVERRKDSNLQDLKSQISGLDHRLRYTQTDKETIEKQTLVSNAREMEIINAKLEEIEPESNKYNGFISKRENEIKKIQDEKNAVEDQVFAEFCEQIGVSNIRSYEEKQLAAQQEKTQKRLEFEKQEGRLKQQLEYIQSHDHQEQLKKLERNIKRYEDEIEKLKAQEKEQIKELDKDQDLLDKLRLEVQAAKGQSDEKEAELKELKKQQGNFLRDETSLKKKISSKERQAEEKYSDRHSLLKQCKMEDIKLPLKRGSLNDIEASQAASSQDDMEIDDSSQSSRSSLKENDIAVNYGRLPERLKGFDDAGEIKSKQQDLVNNINKLDATLSRIPAPNMKAVSKLGNVQNRLKETSDEFETTRKRARRAKMEFEAVQKERYDRFMAAFEHVSMKIDDIYKELANNPSAQAFLGAENAEEPYLEGIGYNCVAPGKRFRPMDNLSGGEKTVAALALLFAIHSFQPSPFFVLDEIDAALDNTNINRVANYIKRQTSENFQCIVISLKEEFFTKVNTVVGVTADPDQECTTTRTLTLDLTNYPE
ncbi:structural maintenance of chromosomes protein 1A-like [Clytia hemisphaerica]|uniref:Structural maintenance of chromosomes protein n=1 Tax=Clytia hemisphaerica TaxID=252671 RepID=A0A7M5XD96_9CNID